jgi:TPR repeat protein
MHKKLAIAAVFISLVVFPTQAGNKKKKKKSSRHQTVLRQNTAKPVFAQTDLSKKKIFTNDASMSFEEFNKIIAADHPKNDELQRAYILTQKSETKQKGLEKLRNNASAQNPHPFAQGLLGELYQADGNRGEAKMYYEMSYHPLAKEFLGDMYYEENDLVNAGKSWQKGCAASVWYPYKKPVETQQEYNKERERFPRLCKNSDERSSIFEILSPEEFKRTQQLGLDYSRLVLKQRFYFHQPIFEKLKEMTLKVDGPEWYEYFIHEVFYKIALLFYENGDLENGHSFLRQAAQEGHEGARLKVLKSIFGKKDNDKIPEAFIQLCLLMARSKDVDIKKEAQEIVHNEPKSDLAPAIFSFLLQYHKPEEVSDFFVCAGDAGLNPYNNQDYERLKNSNAAIAYLYAAKVYADSISQKDSKKKLEKVMLAVSSLEKAIKIDNCFSNTLFADEVFKKLVKYYFVQKDFENVKKYLAKFSNETKSRCEFHIGHGLLHQHFDIKNGFDFLISAAPYDINAVLEIANIFLNKEAICSLKKSEIIELLKKVEKPLLSHTLYAESMLAKLEKRALSINCENIELSLKEELEKNNPTACYEFALACKLMGEYTKAYTWFERAHEAGNKYALGHLGLLLAKGNGIEKDIFKALKYFKEFFVLPDFANSFDILNLLQESAELLYDFARKDSVFAKELIKFEYERFKKSTDSALFIGSSPRIFQLFKDHMNKETLENSDLPHIKEMFNIIQEYQKRSYLASYVLGFALLSIAKKELNFFDKEFDLLDYCNEIDRLLKNALEIPNLDLQTANKRSELVASLYHSVAQLENLSVENRIKFYQRSIDLNPSSEAMIKNFAEFYFDNKPGIDPNSAFKKGMAILESAANNKNVEILKYLANFYLEGAAFPACYQKIVRDEEKAMQYLNLAYKQSDSQAAVMLGNIWKHRYLNGLASGNSDVRFVKKAKKYYTDAFKFDPKNSEALIELGQCSIYSGNLPNALKYFQHDLLINHPIANLYKTVILSDESPVEALNYLEKTLVACHEQRRRDIWDQILKVKLLSSMKITTEHGMVLIAYFDYLTTLMQTASPQSNESIDLRNFIQKLCSSQDEKINLTAQCIKYAHEIAFDNSGIKAQEIIKNMVPIIKKLEVKDQKCENQIIYLCISDIYTRLFFLYSQAKLKVEDYNLFNNTLKEKGIKPRLVVDISSGSDKSLLDLVEFVKEN